MLSEHQIGRNVIVVYRDIYILLTKGCSGGWFLRSLNSTSKKCEIYISERLHSRRQCNYRRCLVSWLNSYTGTSVRLIDNRAYVTQRKQVSVGGLWACKALGFRKYKRDTYKNAYVHVERATSQGCFVGLLNSSSETVWDSYTALVTFTQRKHLAGGGLQAF